MAVYKRSYSSYAGKLTPRWSRFLILTRYSAQALFQSRVITWIFLLTLIFPVLVIASLYLNHNARLLSLLKFRSDHLMIIDGRLFMLLMSIQGSCAFLMTAFVGPGLVAPDLTNNALPLYFCRPLSRTEYVLGRACVILFLLSFVTWIPGLIVFGVETSLSGGAWGWDNRQYAAGILVGSWLWISVLTLLALALSAWVRWKVVAGGLLLGVMFATTGFAGAIEVILRSNAGFYFDPAALVAVIYARFFEVPVHTDISTSGACIAIVLICAFCVWLLSRKIRAFQVVR